MSNTASEQLSKIKERVAGLVKQHKKIVGDFKKKLKAEQLKNSKLKVAAKKRITELKKALQQAVAQKGTKSSDDFESDGVDVDLLSMKNASDAQAQVADLKRELRDEMAKSAQLAAELKSLKGDDTAIDFSKMKNSAYSEAKINSLEEDLKNEIARSRNTQLDADKKIMDLQREFKEEIAEAVKQHNELAGEKEKLEEHIEELDKDKLEQEEKFTKQIEEHLIYRGEAEEFRQRATENIASLEDTVQDQKNKIIDRDNQIKTFEVNVAKLEKEVKRLYDITQKYDIVGMEDGICELKMRVDSYFQEASQKKFHHGLEEMLSLQRKNRQCETHIKEKLANFNNEIEEVEQRLRNSIYDIETSID